MFCVHCGSEIAKGSVYCTACGRRAVPEKPAALPLSREQERELHACYNVVQAKTKMAIIFSSVVFALSLLHIMISIYRADTRPEELVSLFGIYTIMLIVYCLGASIPVNIISRNVQDKADVPINSYKATIIINIVFTAHLLAFSIFSTLFAGMTVIACALVASMNVIIAIGSLGCSVALIVFSGLSLKAATATNNYAKNIKTNEF